MKISQNNNQTDFLNIFSSPNMSSTKGASLTSYKKLQKTLEQDEQKKVAKRILRFRKGKKRKVLFGYDRFRRRLLSQNLFEKKEIRKFKG